VLDLAPPVEWDAIKTRYKTLAKQLHPDSNGGDKAAEEKLKVVNQAYSTLKRAAID
jgi:curved DNA-binding protein CbpA